MKNVSKLICITLLSVVTQGVSASPGSSLGHVSLGLQGGVSFANAETPSDISSTTRTGFMGGINLNIGLNHILSLQPELLYVQRGSDLVNTAGVKASFKQDSIEVPLLVRATFGEKVAPYIFLGPVPIFNISNRLETEIGGNSGAYSYNPKTTDLAGTFGVGLSFGSLFTNLRYSMGLVDTDSEGSNWKSRGVQFLLGINFGA